VDGTGAAPEAGSGPSGAGAGVGPGPSPTLTLGPTMDPVSISKHAVLPSVHASVMRVWRYYERLWDATL
jgi:hypothetical protein